MTRRKPARAFLFAAVFGAAAMGACSLNPQPIPPGEQSIADGGPAGSDFGGNPDGSTNSPADGGITGTPPETGDADAAIDGGDLDGSDLDASDSDAPDE